MLPAVIRVGVNAVALWVCTMVVPGILLAHGPHSMRIITLVAVALIFGIVNAVLKPIIKTVGCAFYLLTLGLIGLVVNALLFLLVSWIAGKLGLPFTVTGFVPAFIGAIVMAVVGFVLHLIIPDSLDERGGLG